MVPDWVRMVMHVEELRAATGSEPWQVQLIDTEGLWEVTAPQTLLFLPADLGPTATLLVHRLAYTHPTQWTTEQLAKQLGIPARKVLEALGRAVDREIVYISPAGILIPTRLGPLPRHMLRNLPPRLRQAHDRLQPTVAGMTST